MAPIPALRSAADVPPGNRSLCVAQRHGSRPPKRAPLSSPAVSALKKQKLILEHPSGAKKRAAIRLFNSCSGVFPAGYEESLTVKTEIIGPHARTLELPLVVRSRRSLFSPHLSQWGVKEFFRGVFPP